MDAAALAMARMWKGDFGPDVAIAVALQNDYRRDECVALLAATLAKMSKARDQRPFTYAAMCAWDWLVWGKERQPPRGMPAAAWDALLKLAISVLDSEKEAALTAAAKIRGVGR